MPAPYRRFIDQQHPAGPGPATLGHPHRVGSHQAHDPMPPHPMMAGHRSDRHHPGVSDKTASEPPSQPALELVVVLDVTFLTVFAPEPAATPHQRRAPAAHPKITNPLRPPVPHLTTAEPTLRAPRPPPGRLHLHLQAVNRVHHNPQHPNTRQVQTNRHNIRHRGLPRPANVVLHRFQRGLNPKPRISPHPTHVSAQGQLYRRSPLRYQRTTVRTVMGLYAHRRHLQRPRARTTRRPRCRRRRRTSPQRVRLLENGPDASHLSGSWGGYTSRSNSSALRYPPAGQ